MKYDTDNVAELITGSQSALRANADIADRITAMLASIHGARPIINSIDTGNESTRERAPRHRIQLSETSCVLDIAPADANLPPPALPTTQEQSVNDGERQLIYELLQDKVRLARLAKDGHRLASVLVEMIVNSVQAEAILDLLLNDAADAPLESNLVAQGPINLHDFILSSTHKHTDIALFPIAFKIVTLLNLDFFICLYQVHNVVIMIVLCSPSSNAQGYRELSKTHFLNTVTVPGYPLIEAVCLFNLVDVPTIIKTYQDFIVLGFATGEVTVYTINHHIMQPGGGFSTLLNPDLIRITYTHISTSHTALITTFLSRSYFSPIRGLIILDVTAKSTSVRTKQMTLIVLHESNCVATMTITLDFILSKKDQKIYNQRTLLDPATIIEIPAKLCVSNEKQTVFSSATSAACEFADASPLCITGHMAGTVVVRLAAGGSAAVPVQGLSEIVRYLASIAPSRCLVFETPVISLVHGHVPSITALDEEIVIACSLGGQLAGWIIRPKDLVTGLPLLALDDETSPIFSSYYRWHGKADCGEAIVSAVLHDGKVVVLTVSGRIVQYSIFPHALVELEDQLGRADMMDTYGSSLAVVNQAELSFI
ncbi:Hypothetical protein GLP15_208 [Giardia lamblia P15]|uniref:Uncharacterized protein n=1 Tax=Giardia intestinalis (strain P15) TaxID=658858 RepID=E1F1H9_GIAIA|nr:Hypothetical protein GLP15_208 [Giardia lamblia P15]